MRYKNINHLWHNLGSEIGHSYAPRPIACDGNQTMREWNTIDYGSYFYKTVDRVNS